MAKRRQRVNVEYDSDDVNSEFYENCQEDRQRAKELFALISEQLEKGIVTLEEGGTLAVKAIEVMQKSNEQLLKLSQEIKKVKPVEEPFSPSSFLAKIQDEEVEQEVVVNKTH